MSTSTPQRTNVSNQHSPSKSCSRRVLGDLTPQAINPAPAHVKTFDPFQVTHAENPLKHAATGLPTAFIDKENITNDAYPKGKKRGIDQVDSAETVEQLKMLARGRDESLSNTGMRLTNAVMQTHMHNNPVSLADPGSPTERNTPTPEPEYMPDSQRSNQSFSDLLNYELCASQKSEHAVAPEPAHKVIPAPVVVEEKKSRAEQLRTRLKFGMYKMKTNQIGKRDADIISTYEITSSDSSDAYNTSRTAAIGSFDDAAATPRVPNITISSPKRVQGPVFVKANLDPFRAIGKLGAAPVQFLPPKEGTSISSRMLHSYDLSSSPPTADLPQSVSPDQLMSPIRQAANYRTPTMSRIRMGHGDEDDIEDAQVTPHQRLQRLKQQHYLESDLTSSAVKGNAAKGLLELMNAGR